MLRDAPAGTEGFQLGLKSRGCSGMAYSLEFCPGDKLASARPDLVVAQDGLRIVVDPKALMYVVGTRMDWVEDAVRAEFVFENPNATGTCGCGESFNVRPVAPAGNAVTDRT